MTNLLRTRIILLDPKFATGNLVSSLTNKLKTCNLFVCCVTDIDAPWIQRIATSFYGRLDTDKDTDSSDDDEEEDEDEDVDWEV